MYLQSAVATCHQGVIFPAITWVSVGGQPEIVDGAEAEGFCREQRMPLVLAGLERKRVVLGLSPIIEVSRARGKPVREENFPPYPFRYLPDGAEIAPHRNLATNH